MPSSYTINQLLIAFEHAYGCVDVRAAIVNEDNHWQVVALAIHLRVDSETSAVADFKATEGQFGRVETETFRVIQQCFSVNDIEAIKMMFDNRRFKVADIELTFDHQPDLFGRSHPVRVTNHESKKRRKWPRIEDFQTLTNRATIHQIFAYDAEIQRAAELVGYGSPVMAVRTLLDIDFTDTTSIGGLWIVADVPLRQRPIGARRTKEGILLSLEVESHHRVRDIACVVRRMSFDERELIERKIVPLALKKEDTGHALSAGDVEMQLDRDDVLLVDVTTKKTGAILGRHEYPFDRLPRAHGNPLYAALTLFCPEPELEALLRDPEQTRAQARLNVNKNEKTFEVSVQWLLSLLGYRAVWLHRYETLWGGKINVGSVDCLAYSDVADCLLVVNCSLGPADPKELGRYAEVRDRLSKQLFADSPTTTHAVVFAACYADPGSDEASAKGVRIVYREEIENLLTCARRGRVFEYTQFTHPLFRDRFRD